jgi:hypothetical protein
LRIPRRLDFSKAAFWLLSTKGTMADMLALYRAHAPIFMHRLIADFGFTPIDAAAVIGNAGYESGGFRLMQELNPAVRGARGGWGVFQWTGARRVAMEAYCARHGLDPASLEANYAWLAVKRAASLFDKVKAFELAFERAGVKHYESRLRWAEIALAAFDKDKLVTPPRPPDSQKKKSAQDQPASRGLFHALLAFIASVAASFRKGR